MISRGTTLKELFSHDPFLETVTDRFGLYSISREHTLEEACLCKGANPDFVIEILKAFSSTSVFPRKELLSFPLQTIVDYLKKTHRYYLNKTLPEIELSTRSLVKNFSHSHPDLVRLTTLFMGYKKALTDHIQEEETLLFPYIESLIKAKQHGKAYLPKDNSRIERFREEHHDDEASLPLIRQIILRKSPVNTIVMPFRIFLIQLELFEKDLMAHSMVEEEILIPKALQLKKSLELNA